MASLANEMDFMETVYVTSNLYIPLMFLCFWKWRILDSRDGHGARVTVALQDALLKRWSDARQPLLLRRLKATILVASTICLYAHRKFCLPLS